MRKLNYFLFLLASITIQHLGAMQTATQVIVIPYYTETIRKVDRIRILVKQTPIGWNFIMGDIQPGQDPKTAAADLFSMQYYNEWQKEAKEFALQNTNLKKFGTVNLENARAEVYLINISTRPDLKNKDNFALREEKPSGGKGTGMYTLTAESIMKLGKTTKEKPTTNDGTASPTLRDAYKDPIIKNIIETLFANTEPQPIYKPEEPVLDPKNDPAVQQLDKQIAAIEPKVSEAQQEVVQKQQEVDAFQKELKAAVATYGIAAQAKNQIDQEALKKDQDLKNAQDALKKLSEELRKIKEQTALAKEEAERKKAAAVEQQKQAEINAQQKAIVNLEKEVQAARQESVNQSKELATKEQILVEKQKQYDQDYEKLSQAIGEMLKWLDEFYPLQKERDKRIETLWQQTGGRELLTQGMTYAHLRDQLIALRNRGLELATELFKIAIKP